MFNVFWGTSCEHDTCKVKNIRKYKKRVTIIWVWICVGVIGLIFVGLVFPVLKKRSCVVTEAVAHGHLCPKCVDRHDGGCKHTIVLECIKWEISVKYSNSNKQLCDKLTKIEEKGSDRHYSVGQTITCHERANNVIDTLPIRDCKNISRKRRGSFFITLFHFIIFIHSFYSIACHDL